MRFKNIGTSDLLWHGVVIQPGDYCPDDVDLSWRSHFEQMGILEAEAERIAPIVELRPTQPMRKKGF